MELNNTQKLYTLKEACELLSISVATGRNWVKSGRLIPNADISGQKNVFDEASLLSLKDALVTGTVPGLKSRRNKTYVTGKGAYNNYISSDSPNHTALKQLQKFLTQENIILNDTLLYCLLRHCAEQLIIKAGFTETGLFLPLLEDLIDTESFKKLISSHAFPDNISYSYIPSEDTLGYFYLSLRNLNERKASGSYYTPAWLAKQLVETHLPSLKEAPTVFDPSCGTGIFLLQLPEAFPLSHIYGNDINPFCAALTRINLALKYHITTLDDVALLKKNILSSDYLERRSDSYDVILGNPPWGAKLPPEQKRIYQNHLECASGSSVEIFDLFIEQSIRHLNYKGTLSFLLPESLLTVKAHTPVRKLLLQHTTMLSVEYLGEAFEQVHCPSIILTVSKDNWKPFFKDVAITLSDKTAFSTRVERTVNADSFSFSLTDEEYQLLQKILTCPDCTTLVDKSIFALGIVTGNNTGLLHSTLTPGLEPIIKGSDISKYHINSNSGYVAFFPEKFQQTAPEKYYRAPEKLFYRFINKQLTFAYDNSGLLSLNSCNIVIPKIPGLSVKYVLAILNSSVAQFVFKKKFHSVKVLRSHIEQIPIPMADKNTQKEIEALVDKLMSLDETSHEYIDTYHTLDYFIAKLFSLTEEEYILIRA